MLKKSLGIENNDAKQSVLCVKTESEKLQASHNKTTSPKEIDHVSYTKNYSIVTDVLESNAEFTLKKKFEETLREELNFPLEVKEVSETCHQNFISKSTRSVDSKRHGSRGARKTRLVKDQRVEKRRLMSKDRFVCNEDEGVLSFYNDTVAGLDVIELSTNKSVKQNNETKFTEFHYQIFTPRYKPPSRSEIVTSLAEFNISEHKNQKPFMSNALDFMGKKLVGNQVLRV